MSSPKKISLLLPSRNRLELLKQCIKSIEVNTFDKENLEILIYIDKDDLETNKISSKTITIKKFVQPQLSMGGMNTFLLNNSTGKIIILINDDIIIKSKNWDKKIRDFDHSIKDNIYLAYPNDLYKKKDLCTFPVLSKKTTEILIKPYPIEYSGSFIDTHLLDIFMRLKKVNLSKIYYLEDIIFEHLHFRAKKNVKDEIYLLRNRFEGDNEFHSLIDLRKTQFKNILEYLKTNKKPSQNTIYERYPINDVGLIKLIFQTITDSQLPYFWKYKRLFYYISRYIYSKLFTK